MKFITNIKQMAQRAGAKDTIVVKDPSHVVISNPSVVAHLIEKAAAATVR
jgi:hypothetical protein